jgi:hypothetical protein
VLSSTALVVSLGTLAYTIYKDRRDTKEFITCTVQRSLVDYDTAVQPFGDTGELLVRWSGTAANDGAVPVALLEHRLEETDGKVEYYTGMDGGLFSSSGTPLQFPLNLSPGQAVSFVLETEVLLPKETYQKIASKGLEGRRISTKKLMLSLGDEGVDFWGNDVKVKRYDKRSFTYEGPSLSDQMRNPAFSLAFTSARGNSVYTQFSYYGLFFSRPFK